MPIDTSTKINGKENSALSLGCAVGCVIILVLSILLAAFFLSGLVVIAFNFMIGAIPNGN